MTIITLELRISCATRVIHVVLPALALELDVVVVSSFDARKQDSSDSQETFFPTHKRPCE